MDLVGQERCEHIFQVVLLVSLVRFAVSGAPEGVDVSLRLIKRFFFAVSFSRASLRLCFSPRGRAVRHPDTGTGCRAAEMPTGFGAGWWPRSRWSCVLLLTDFILCVWAPSFTLTARLRFDCLVHHTLGLLVVPGGGVCRGLGPRVHRPLLHCAGRRRGGGWPRLHAQLGGV